MKLNNPKDWAPFQSDKIKEIINNLDEDEHKQLEKVTKELGRKIGFYCAGPFAVLTACIFIYIDMAFYPRLIIVGILFVIMISLCSIFIIKPYRKKQLELLSNSNYAKSKEMNV